MLERLGAFVKQGVPGPMRSRTSVAGGEHTKMRGLYKAEDAREIRSLRQAGSPRDLCEPGTPCFSKVLGASINPCFSMASGFLCSHPRQQRCGSAALHHTSLRSLTATASLIGSC